MKPLLIDILVVQAESKLQEHGLQPAAKSRKDTQITPPEDFMQTMTPRSLGVKSGASQTVYDVGLQGSEEMDFSDINFADFSEFDHRYVHLNSKNCCPGGLTANLAASTNYRP
jgi:hypothetical protein